jgi:hypothetical protein
VTIKVIVSVLCGSTGAKEVNMLKERRPSHLARVRKRKDIVRLAKDGTSERVEHTFLVEGGESGGQRNDFGVKRSSISR